MRRLYRTTLFGHHSFAMMHVMDIYFGAYIGHAAGIMTALLWTATSLLFTASGRRLGTTALNTIRICFAVGLLATTHRILNGYWIPHAQTEQVIYLALSGLIGLSIGDQALFTAFVEIGPRLSMLIMTTSPIWAMLFGWIALGETLAPSALLGIGLTVGGVVWVVLEKPKVTTGSSQRRLRGYVLAMIGAACQAGGLMLSKIGMGHGWLEPSQHMAPQTATLIRMSFAALGMIPIVYIHRRRRQPVDSFPRVGSKSVGITLALCGAVVGPFLGVWMSLVASDRAPLGVAQTLCSLTPLFILPFAVLIHKEKISKRAVGGAVIAVLGSALLFFDV